MYLGFGYFKLSHRNKGKVMGCCTFFNYLVSAGVMKGLGGCIESR